ncbi:hypothetical protein [Aurantibacter aestuarii]|uniref:Aromatic hydrocarbon degradation protein n=1 Tax=Aurantibacter aestuarii TaxID=1266046 RepID=A0A2T1NE34_9FLAO|nr:hypothetical protein [Aurantibacter aestuarii]PSG90711.1 hypothetical protein C7H52_05385 [Aurantibacter aestuarii]
MIKKLLIVFVCVFCLQTYAQDGVASPYSYYGIGSLKFKGTVENNSMGSMGVYNDSIHMNLQNPATYGGQNLPIYNNESRPVIFTVGGSSNKTCLDSNSSSAETSTQTFDYLAVAFPLGKLGIGFGLLPYTSVGYKLDNFNSFGQITHRYRGSGGVNKTYFSAGYQFENGLSFGVTTDYNFGNIKNNTIVFPYNSDGTSLSYQTREDNRSDLSGLSFNFGAHYKKMVSDKLEIQTSLTFAPEANLKSINTRSFNAIIFDNAGNEVEVNTVDVDLDTKGLNETNLTLPSNFTIGAGIGEPRKWFAGVDFKTQNTSEFSNPLYNYENTTFENSNTIAIGGFYIPKYNSFSSYFKRMVYRAGMRFENTGLKINNEPIKEFGISFGLGLPVGNTFSNANLGFELGNRGTTDSNLIKENFFKVQLSLSLNDRWFQKKRYN